jgi:hypothetical protein
MAPTEIAMGALNLPGPRTDHLVVGGTVKQTRRAMGGIGRRA